MGGLDSLNFRPGDPIRAADMMTIVQAVRDPQAVLRGGPGVNVRQGPRGQVQVSASVRLAFVGKASGAIPPRSGSAWGTGVVTMLGFDGTDEFDLLDYDVYNPSDSLMTSPNGIDDGKRVWVQEDESGWLIVTPLECASGG